MRTYGVIAVLLVVVEAAAAQTVPVDQGTFAITRAGAPHGTESFQIMRQASQDGPTFTLTATRTVEGRVIRTTLKTDSAGAPMAYNRQVTGDGPGTLSAAGKPAGRLTVNETAGRNHSSKDYQMAAGALLVDDDLVHQLYFVCLKGASRIVSYVSPGARIASDGKVVDLGLEQVELGNKARVDAMHFAFGEGAARRDIWIDSNKRLLRVSIPGRQIDALREEPPR